MKVTLNNVFSNVSTIVLLALTFSACGEKDLYDPNALADMKKTEFQDNFLAKYPNVNLNQSWDFSTGARGYAVTRAEGDIVPQVADDWYYVEQQSIEYFEDKLEEGVNNRAIGKPFIMTVPNNGFAIVPIYQGAASFVWDLHMVVEQGGEVIQDVTVWEKHSNIEVQLTDEQLEYDAYPTKKLSLYDGKNFLEEYGWSRDGETWYTTKQAYGLHDSHVEYLGGASWGGEHEGEKGWWENYECGWNTTLAKAIRTKFIEFEGLPVGANIYFYLSVWNSQEDKDKSVAPTPQSSLNQMMVALENAPRPTNVDAKNEVTIIGCEDNSSDGSDWDMNDLVFMVVGYPNVPKPIEIVDKKYDEVVGKRYMVEDLGSTDDFDFNDVVVDVQEIRTHEIELVNGAKTKDEVVSTRQQAIVRAMGGTLDFALKIGNTTWTKSGAGFDVSTMYGTDGRNYDAELSVFDVEGWVPASNNVSVTVEGTNSNGITIEFSQPGKVPMMIATDTNINWMIERQGVPMSWWTEGPSNN